MKKKKKNKKGSYKAKKKNKRIVYKIKNRKKFKNKRKINKKSNKKIKKKKKNNLIKNYAKINKPLNRIKKLKFSKFKIKKIKINKKKINQIRKNAGKIATIKIQNVINFLLTPIFRAYDNYFENKKKEKLERIHKEKIEKEKKIKIEERLNLVKKQQELRDEIKIARERSQDLKKFIRKEQAILRKEQSEKRRLFLEEIKLEKKIESFRKRELIEIQNLEKLALQEQREDYKPVEDRLEKIKEKYRLIREQKIRERVEALGVEISDADTKEDLIKKEKEYSEQRYNIELVLESFYRAANSLIFQLNKRYIPKHKSILRVIDRRYESNECFIKYDDSPDEEWLILIYLEDSDAQKGKIIVENKANPEKIETKSFETKEIFTYSDYLVDSMTAHIDKERKKKTN